MSKIYAIRDDGIKFKQLDLQVFDLLSDIPDHLTIEDITEFHIRNTALSSWWKTPNTEFTSRSVNPDGQIPDISCWIDATLVLSPRAHRLLGEILQPFGEFLPVRVGEKNFQIFNCFEIGEVDKEKVEYDHAGDMQLGVKYFEFVDSVASKLVFKTPVESCLTLYCNDRFKEIIESFELTGIIFDEKLLIESPFSDKV